MLNCHSRLARGMLIGSALGALACAAGGASVDDAGPNAPNRVSDRRERPPSPDSMSGDTREACRGPENASVGFEYTVRDMLATETPGTVSAVSDDALVIEAVDGQLFTFLWRGPGLAAAFAAREPVRMHYQPWRSRPYFEHSWSMVRGVRSTAAALQLSGAYSLESPQQVPDGPLLDYTRTCSPFWSVTASLPGAPTTSIAPGETATVGPWQITNVHAWHPPVSPVHDPGWRLQATALQTDKPQP